MPWGYPATHHTLHANVPASTLPLILRPPDRRLHSSTTTKATTTVAVASSPTTQVTNTDTSAPVSVTSTPAATCTIRGTTVGTPWISVLDAGQGDSIRIQSPARKTMLVDAGPSDAGSRVVADLKARGITSLDAAGASHGDVDHIGSYQTVLSQFSVARPGDDLLRHRNG